MPLMIADIDLHVAYGGPDVRFRAGVEQPVRDSLVQAALQAGARLVGGDTTPPPGDPKPSDEAIAAAIRELQEHPTAFGKDGRPKVREIERVLGTNIDADDRDRVWDLMNDG